MKEALYSRRSNLVIGFHGCDKSVVDKVIAGEDSLIASTNDYDWLGHGVYFWENNETRALQYANEMLKRGSSSIKEPAVIGAVIDLGYCMDLTDTLYLEELKEAYHTLVDTCKLAGIDLPQNTDIGKSKDKLMRRLDCAVIETAHQINEEAEERTFDSVKGVFWEGEQLYPGAEFREKDHIQICVRNPNCIKGLFLPRKLNDNFPNP
ncbi:hypothetical protein BOVA604_1202 [Bacteroides ovatus]|jgi:hypothetical protein|uniref:hypothetical protein n=1 Tax=Bacteroides TaxID=816 RepID=UPI000E8AFEB0|nr:MULTISPECIES: hypothetical protein [Bacteroides]MCS3178339.1 hypothetical protein [Candidatus Bacteroides intestinigallinarum]RGN59271.1 hypothetical protein DXB58_14120 [Bacteroides sp. OM05-10AA]RGQ65002.1 hypothetical protein DWY87_14990 [Bacteroides sp. AF27-33]CAG9891661.1 hypothetical protein BOVA604_1202 [Bacteroides ovatus]